MRLATISRDIASSCLCRRVQGLSRRITRLYDEALREVGLTANQLTTLVVIQRSGEVSSTELAQLLGAEKSTVSRTLSRMARNGWLRREVDGRQRLASLTTEGCERIREAHASWARAQSAAEETLGQELLRAIHSLDQREG